MVSITYPAIALLTILGTATVGKHIHSILTYNTTNKIPMGMPSFYFHMVFLKLHLVASAPNANDSHLWKKFLPKTFTESQKSISIFPSFKTQPTNETGEATIALDLVFLVYFMRSERYTKFVFYFLYHFVFWLLV